MMNTEDIQMIYGEAHRALHRCWTRAVGTADYVKDDFRKLDLALQLFARACGVNLAI